MGRLIVAVDKRSAPKVASDLRNCVAGIARDLDTDMMSIATAIGGDNDVRRELLHLTDALRRSVGAAVRVGRERNAAANRKWIGDVRRFLKEPRR